MTIADRIATSLPPSLQRARERFNERFNRAVHRFVKALYRDMKLGQADIDEGRVITLDEARKRWKSS